MFTSLVILLLNLTFMKFSYADVPISCEFPCQPPPSRPLYGTPPPLSPPKSPPPPSDPVYESPPSPCPPPPQMPAGPLYGAPPPPLQPTNCQPSMQNCAYSPPNPNPNQDIYQPLDFASHLQLNCLHILGLMFLLFLHF